VIVGGAGETVSLGASLAIIGAGLACSGNFCLIGPGGAATEAASTHHVTSGLAGDAAINTQTEPAIRGALFTHYSVALEVPG
jgi:hypothetical protein